VLPGETTTRVTPSACRVVDADVRRLARQGADADRQQPGRDGGDKAQRVDRVDDRQGRRELDGAQASTPVERRVQYRGRRDAVRRGPSARRLRRCAAYFTVSCTVLGDEW